MRITNVSGEDIELILPVRLEIKAGARVVVRDSLRGDPMICGLVRKGYVQVSPNRTRFEHINEAD